MASRNRVKLDPASEERLQNLLEFYESVPESVTLLREMETRLMASFDDLSNAITNNSNVVRSAVALIQGLAGRVAACGADPEKLADLVNSLNRDAGQLGDAVAANTVAEPTGSSTPTPANPEPVDPAEPEAPANPEPEPTTPVEPAPVDLPPDIAPSDPDTSTQ